MKASIKALNLITQFEGMKLKAYRCSAGVPTIGIGTTVYPDGRRVKMGDTCTKEQAFEYLAGDVNKRSVAIGDLPVNQNQYDAIISFVYNVGLSAWRNSTLRRKVISNASDPAIKTEFLRWDKAGGKILAGLTRRREAEAKLYFS